MTFNIFNAAPILFFFCIYVKNLKLERLADSGDRLHNVCGLYLFLFLNSCPFYFTVRYQGCTHFSSGSCISSGVHTAVWECHVLAFWNNFISSSSSSSSSISNQSSANSAAPNDMIMTKNNVRQFHTHDKPLWTSDISHSHKVWHYQGLKIDTRQSQDRNYSSKLYPVWASYVM
jgi:hypothetical protein